MPRPRRISGQPTVILAKTVKGYGMGEAGEGQNITHQQKKMGEAHLQEFRDRFDLPSDRRAAEGNPVPPLRGRQPRAATISASAARRWAAICRRAVAQVPGSDDPAALGL